MSGDFIFALASFGVLLVGWVALPMRPPRK
jgi:hypothetical protein